MDIETKFNDLGVDAITGVKLMDLTGITPTDFIDERRFQQFKEVIKYFKDKPEMNYIINQITVGKNVDKLSHIWGYVELSKQKQNSQEILKSIQERKDSLDGIDVSDPKYPQIMERIESELLDMNEHVNQLDLQLYAYSK